jgi:hypothetical protein
MARKHRSRHQSRKRNPDNKVMFLILAAVGGLAAAYFLAPKPPAVGGDATLLNNGGGSPPTPQPFVPQITGGGGGTGTGGKTAAYGRDAVVAYQQRMRQVYNTLKESLAAMPGFFAETGLADPGAADGVWGPATERASQAFLPLVQNSLVYLMADPDAAAKKDSAFAFALLGSSNTEPGLVARVAEFNRQGKYITNADKWALLGGTGVFVKRQTPKQPFKTYFPNG